MKRVYLSLLFFISASLFIAGCDTFSGAGPESIEGFRAGINPSSTGLSHASIPVNNYLVHFDGRTYDGSLDQTRFAYTVSGTGTGDILTRFGVELPGCAPELAGYAPVAGVNIDDSARIEWNKDIATTGSGSYSITFPGNVPEGMVRVGVKSGGVDGVALAPGPCGGTGGVLYEVSGTVFTDANQDGLLESEETGVANVTIHLLSGLSQVASATTDAYGAYVFADQPAGDYTVMIPSITADEDFNEALFDDFSYTGVTPEVAIDVAIGPDAGGINFGFDPNVEELMEEFETGAIATSGETVRFWKAQLKGAMGEVSHNGVEAEIDAVTMQGYLDEIEDLLLDTPYQFDDGNEFQAAFDILRTNSREDIDQLLKELLAAELNHVSGRGITNVEGLQEVLIGWGEALVLDNPVGPSVQQAGVERLGPVSLSEATGIFRAINGGGSGGGGNE